MKTCLMCGTPLHGKREDSKFCSDACKAKHWKINKNGDKNELKGIDPLREVQPINAIKPTKPEYQPLEPFSNLVGTNAPEANTGIVKQEATPLPAQYITQQQQTTNLSYAAGNMKISLCRKEIAAVEQEIKRISDAIAQVKQNKGSLLYIAGAGTGALIGYSMSGKNENPFVYALLGGLLGLGAGSIVNGATKEMQAKIKRETIAKYEKEKSDRQAQLNDLKAKLEWLEWELRKTAPTTVTEIRILNPAYTLALKQAGEKPLTGQKTELKNGTEDFGSDKISSMKNIADMKFQLLNFQGRWLDFFGQPQTNFFLVIHGMSGEGKSHFAMQLTKYLAEQFGRVLYVSGEEGWASTFQQKIMKLGVNAVPNAYGGDIRTGEELLTEVPANKFHFIVIDSLNNMGIDAELMRQIRARFKHSAIIAICQNTKDGKVRGSYEIMHDSDMIVKVADGIALTIKNRFKEKGKKFNVFEALRSKDSKIIPISGKRGSEGTGIDTELKNTI